MFIYCFRRAPGAGRRFRLPPLPPLPVLSARPAGLLTAFLLGSLILTPVCTATTALSAAVPSSTPAGAPSYDPPWSWPLSPAPVISRTFRAPPQRWLAGHRGVDLAAPPGTRVLSPAAGTVVFTGQVVNRAVLTVDLGGGLLASFEPVDASTAPGDAVAAGQELGTLSGPAAPAHCPDSCLHWGVRLNGEYVNPLNYVTDRRPSVLLPLR